MASRANLVLGPRTNSQTSTPDKGDLVFVNNSFVYRDMVKTRKNSKYIAGRFHGEGAVDSWGVVEWDHQLNVDFRHVSAQSGNIPALLDLDEAVDDELSRISP